MATTQEIQDWLTANPGVSDAQIASAMNQYGVTADQMATATGLSPLAVASRMASAAPSAISYTPGPDTEGGQIRDSYAINNKGVNPIYSTVAGTGGDDPNAGAISGVAGFSGGIEHIGGRDYTAQYDASGKFLGYRPYAGESFFGSTVKPLLPIIASAIAPGLGEFIGGATGLTGANLAATTGATLGGGAAALTGQDVLKGALTGGVLGYAGNQLSNAISGSRPIDTNGWDMTSAANYDNMLNGVGNNLTGLSDLQLAANYDAGLTNVGSNLSNMPSNIVTSVTTPGYYDEITGKFIQDPNGPLQGPLDNTSGTTKITNSSFDPTTKTWTSTDPSGTTKTYADTTSTFTPKTASEILTAANATAAGAGALTLDKIKKLLGSTSSTTGLSGLPAFLGALGVLKGLVGDSSNTTVPTYAAPSRDTRSLPQWDWNSINAQAAQQGLTPGQFVARNFPQAVSGAYSQAAPVQKARGGVLNALAHGGGSGRDDTIPAWLSDGEYVMDAETVSLLGDGSTKDGAHRLDEMRAKIREHKGKSMARGKFSANAKSPLAYLKASS